MTHEEQVALIAWLRRPHVAWSAVTEQLAHVAEAAGVPRFDIVTPVPGTWQRDGELRIRHPGSPPTSCRERVTTSPSPR